MLRTLLLCSEAHRQCTPARRRRRRSLRSAHATPTARAPDSGGLLRSSGMWAGLQPWTREGATSDVWGYMGEDANQHEARSAGEARKEEEGEGKSNHGCVEFMFSLAAPPTGDLMTSCVASVPTAHSPASQGLHDADAYAGVCSQLVRTRILSRRTFTLTVLQRVPSSAMYAYTDVLEERKPFLS